MKCGILLNEIWQTKNNWKKWQRINEIWHTSGQGIKIHLNPLSLSLVRYDLGATTTINKVLPYARLPAVARGYENLCECLQLRQGEHWAGAEVYIVEKTIYLYQHGILRDAE